MIISAAACGHCGQSLATVEREASGPGWRMQQGDCLDLLGRLPPGSIDAIITDPPYGSGGGTIADRRRPTKEKYVNTDAEYKNAVPDFSGDSVHPLEWRASMQRFWSAVAKVLHPEHGVFASMIDWRNLTLMADAASTAGLVVRGTAIWDKGPGSRPYRGGFRLQTEMIVWGSIGTMPRRDYYASGVLKHARPSAGKLHLTPKPVALMQEIVRICRPGGLILDPYAGSSSTGVAALAEGYRYHGMEMVPHYYDTSVARLGAVTDGC